MFSSNNAATISIYPLPYTTLFRSFLFAHQLLCLDAGGKMGTLRTIGAVFSAAAGFDGEQRADLHLVGIEVLAVDALRHKQQDRKSTRLNSSHGYISYAVFCLKKKS